MSAAVTRVLAALGGEVRFCDQVSQVALDIAGRVTRGQLKDPAAQKKLVNQYLDEIETKN